MLSSWFGLEPIPICSIDPAPFSGWGQESRSIPRWRNSGCPVGGRGGASTSSCHPDPPPDHLRDLRNPRTGPVGREKRDNRTRAALRSLEITRGVPPGFRPGSGRHFVPTSSSWLNLVVSELTQRQLKRLAVHSVGQLVHAITAYIDDRNRAPKPFVWTATVQGILAKINPCQHRF